MKRILAALDFSELTPQVVEQAKLLTKIFDAQLCLMHADYLLPFLGAHQYDQHLALEAYESQKERNKQELQELKNELARAGIEAEIILHEGDVDESIIEEAQKFRADLIILGSHKHSKLYHLFFGNISENIIQKATCPVMVIPS